MNNDLKNDLIKIKLEIQKLENEIIELITGTKIEKEIKNAIFNLKQLENIDEIINNLQYIFDLSFTNIINKEQKIYNLLIKFLKIKIQLIEAQINTNFSKNDDDTFKEIFKSLFKNKFFVSVFSSILFVIIIYIFDKFDNEALKEIIQFFKEIF